MSRVWIIPIAAVLIVAACAYKLTRTYDVTAPREIERLCPAGQFDFSLPNQNVPFRYVSFKGFLTRHDVLVIFFDGRRGAEADPVLVRCRRDYEALTQRRVIVLGISTNLRQQNRPPRPGGVKWPNQPGKPFPFSLLTDDNLVVHRTWGRIDTKTGKPLPGVFVITRTGYVRCDGKQPVPVDDPQEQIDRLLDRP